MPRVTARMPRLRSTRVGRVLGAGLVSGTVQAPGRRRVALHVGSGAAGRQRRLLARHPFALPWRRAQGDGRRVGAASGSDPQLRGVLRVLRQALPGCAAAALLHERGFRARLRDSTFPRRARRRARCGRRRRDDERIFRAQAQAQAAIVSRLRTARRSELAARTPPSSCAAAPQSRSRSAGARSRLGMAQLLPSRLRARSAQPRTPRALWYRTAWEHRERAAARAFDRAGIDDATPRPARSPSRGRRLAGRCDLTTLVRGASTARSGLLTRIRKHGGALPAASSFRLQARATR